MTRVVVAGASGFIGRRAVGALETAGYEVRCGSRDPERAAREQLAYTWCHLDVSRPSTLDAAFDQADHLLYLVHHLRDEQGESLVDVEQQAARHVRRAAEDHGLKRIVYVGVPEAIGLPSKHLTARLATGDILRGGPIPTLELQASMILGADSQSFMLVRDLAHRLPVFALPSWTSTKTQPIGVDDVVAAIVAAHSMPLEASVRLPLPGPEVLTARQILYRVAAQAGRRPYSFTAPWLTTEFSSKAVTWLARTDASITQQLVEGLTHDLVATRPTFWSHHPKLPRTSFDEAVRRALDEEPPGTKWERRWERWVHRFTRKL